MARQALPAYAAYHVTSRGVDGCPIAYDDDDRGFWVSLFRIVASREEWKVPAWCFMDNHYHALVETHLERLSRGMHTLNGIYAQRFNERYGRVGHLFKDRFHAQLIRDDQHLANACDYIWANPVRAGMCAEVHHYPWSGSIRLGAGVHRR